MSQSNLNNRPLVVEIRQWEYGRKGGRWRVEDLVELEPLIVGRVEDAVDVGLAHVPACKCKVKTHQKTVYLH